MVGDLVVVLANQARWVELDSAFGRRGAGYGCQCQRYKLARGEAFREFPVEDRGAVVAGTDRLRSPGVGDDGRVRGLSRR
jgi:hypothetical protein